jgi:hypothetical protein
MYLRRYSRTLIEGTRGKDAVMWVGENKPFPWKLSFLIAMCTVCKSIVITDVNDAPIGPALVESRVSSRASEGCRHHPSTYALVPPKQEKKERALGRRP